MLSEIELRYDIEGERNALSADETHPAKSLVVIGSSRAQDNRDQLGPSFLERGPKQREQVSCRLLLTGEKIENPVSRTAPGDSGKAFESSPSPESEE